MGSWVTTMLGYLSNMSRGGASGEGPRLLRTAYLVAQIPRYSGTLGLVVISTLGAARVKSSDMLSGERAGTLLGSAYTRP